MTKAVLQLWVERERGYESRPNGASIHKDEKSRKEYIEKIYSDRNVDDVPNTYECVIGEPIDVLLKNNLLGDSKTIIIKRHEFNNLLDFNEILCI